MTRHGWRLYERARRPHLRLVEHVLEPHLEHEAWIVWLLDPDGAHTYVREVVIEGCPHRSRQPARRRYPGRLVAFAVLRSDVARPSEDGFVRRVWVVLDVDPEPGQPGPGIAVDPTSIRARRPSVPLTEETTS